MATLGVRDFFKIWLQSGQDDERLIKKGLLEGLDEYKLAIPDTLQRLKVGQQIYTPVVHWIEEDGYPDRLTAQLSGSPSPGTLTISGYLFGKDLSSDSEAATLAKQVLRVGTILQRPSDGVQVKVTAITGLVSAGSLSVSVAEYGNTTMTDDGSAITWHIVAEVWSDFKDADQPRGLDRRTREVGTQIHAETFEIPKTRENTRYEVVSNEVEHQLTRLLEKLRRQLAKACLMSRPYHTGSAYAYGNQTETPTMCGMCTWPEIIASETGDTTCYTSNSNKRLTLDTLDTLVRKMWLDRNADFNTGKWAIICDPVTFSQIQDFHASYRRVEKDDKRVGFKVDYFDSKIGASFEIIQDALLMDRPGTLLVANLAKHYYGYYANDKMDRKEIPTQGRYRRWLVSFQSYGVVCRNPRSNIGMIYNIKTT